jgi:hypothetical protein
MSGRDITPEGKAVLAENMRRRWAENRQQILDARNSPEQRRRGAERLRRRWSDPEERARLLAARNAPEAKAKKAASLVAYYSDPANRARQSVAVAAALAERAPEQRAEQSAKISAGMMAAPTEERSERAARAAQTMRAPGHPPKATPEETKRRLVAALLASPTPEIEPPKRKRDLSDLLPRRRGDTSPALSLDPVISAACADEREPDGDAPKRGPGRPPKPPTDEG